MICNYVHMKKKNLCTCIVDMNLNATGLCEKLKAVKLRKGEIVKREKDQRFPVIEGSFSA